MLLFFVLKNKCSQIKLSNRCWRTRTLWMQISRFLSISLQLPMWGRDSCFSSHILWAARIPIPSLTKTKENGQLSEQFTMTCCHYHFHEQRSVLFQLAFEKNGRDGCPLKKKMLKIKNWAAHCIRRWFMLTMPPADLLLARRVCEVLCL